MTGDAGETVTLQAAAEALGVHYMTAYRYVRLGLLPARKQGDAWRVARADLDGFRRPSAGPVGPVARAGEGRREAGRGRKRAPWAERLESRLVAGDGRGAWSVMEAALAAGTDLTDLYLDVVAPALVSIGERWASGEIDVASEHRASGIVVRLLGRLGPRFTRRGRRRGTVILGCAPGELHALPVALAADVVRAARYEVSDLGADVPAESYVRLAGGVPRLVAVGVSVTTADYLDGAAHTIARLRAGIGGVPVLVGGRAVRDDEHARALGADGYAVDARALVGVLEGYTA